MHWICIPAFPFDLPTQVVLLFFLIRPHGVVHMYHPVWADQREKQGYKCDVSLMGGIQIPCTLENDDTLYISTTNPLLIVGLNLLIIILSL